jgi:hypothetical protein
MWGQPPSAVRRPGRIGPRCQPSPQLRLPLVILSEAADLKEYEPQSKDPCSASGARGWASSFHFMPEHPSLPECEPLARSPKYRATFPFS